MNVEIAMDEKLFNELLESVKEAGEILRGKKAPSREFHLEPPDPETIKAIRENFGLTQEKFSALLGISVGTLRDWEQGRRKPRGPAWILLEVAAKHPEAVLDTVQGSR